MKAHETALKFTYGDKTMTKTSAVNFGSVLVCQGRQLRVTQPVPSSQLKTAISLMMAFILSWLLVTATEQELNAQAAAPAYVDLSADQLDQLVAPIALDPDPLVAQILTASTYPDQVAAADLWLNQNMGLTPDQRASGADGMSWDTAVKGLTAFPAALDNLAKNSAWTAQLGNAYYNQPGDVMNAIQAMRTQAQQSDTLVTTPQQRVVVDAGVIGIVPVDPAVIYVPYYNPWRIWGTLFASYPGYVVLPPPPGIVVGVGLAFDPPVLVTAYASFGWGFSAWVPEWTSGVVLCNHGIYISQSMTVANHGFFGGHDRGVFEHGGPGVPKGYQASAHAGAARATAAQAKTNNLSRTSPKSQTRTSNSSKTANRSQAHNSRSSSTANRSQARNTRSSSAANRSQAHNSRSSSTANRSQARNTGSSSAANRSQAHNSRSSSTANRSQARNTRSSSAANRSQARSSRSSSTANRSQARSPRSSGVGSRSQPRTVAGRQSSGGRSSGGHTSGGRRR